MCGQGLHGRGQLVAGGVGAGVEQDDGQVDQLFVAQPIAVVFHADQLGNQVVAQRPPTRAYQLLDMDQVVAKDLGPVWAEGDRPLLLSLGEQCTEFVAAGVHGGGEGGQCDVDGHGFTIRFRRPPIIGRIASAARTGRVRTHAETENIGDFADSM